MEAQLSAILARLPEQSPDSSRSSTLSPSAFTSLQEDVRQLTHQVQLLESALRLVKGEWEEYLDRLNRAAERERKSRSRSDRQLQVPLEEEEPVLSNGEELPPWGQQPPPGGELKPELSPEARVFLLQHPNWRPV